MNRIEALQVLDGLMLGDGGMRRYLDTAVFSMKQSKHTISIEDHLKWEYWLRDNVFAVLDVKTTVGLYWETFSMGAKKGQKYQVVRLESEYSPLLAQAYDEWYTGGEWIAPKGREDYPSAYYVRGTTKVIPGRLMGASILPICSLVPWFLGDGGSSWCKPGRLALTPSVMVSFSTYCFTEEEVHHLITMLNNMGVNTTKPGRKPHESGSGLIIYLSQDTIDYFMSLIEPLILEIFGDSIGPSYKNMIKYKQGLEGQTINTINRLRELVGR